MSSPAQAASHRVPALDGLRAVAVLAVMGYHAGLAPLSGGFLGVDVFFVLSGFLITRLLAAEHARSGRLRLLHFYVRRTLRLLPGLAAMCGLLLVWVWHLPYPAMAGPVEREMAATLLYVANWAEIRGQIRPLGFFGHAWSLAIEEQFYIVWPLVLGAMLRSWSHRTKIAAVGFAAAASGLLRALMWTGPEASMRVFHGSDTRAEALLVGCATALILDGGRLPFPPRKARALGAAANASAVVLALALRGATPDAAWMFRGGFTVVALAVACVILQLANAPQGLLARVLSARPLVRTGRISYGLYLWHWPIFLALAPVFTGLAPLPTLALRFTASFAAAIASWLLVERWFLLWKRRWSDATES